MYIILLFIAAIVLLIISISRFKIHPFIAIMGVSLILAIAVGIPLKDIPDIIGKGFSNTFASIGLVIILGMLIGSLLEQSGAAYKLADMVEKSIGKRHPELAMLLIGFIISIPVFCDSGFVIMNPIRKAMSRSKHISPVTLTVALSAGLYCSHVFIPPTPGPVAAAGFLGLENHLLLVILMGIIVSIPCLAVAYFFARFIGKRVHSSEENEEAPISEQHSLPSGWASILPILLPIILMAVGSAASFFHFSGILLDICCFFGKPFIALAIGYIVAVIMLGRHIPKESASLRSITEKSLKDAGPILFITASGGVLGKVIMESGLVEMVINNVAVISGFGILLPFIIAAILKTTQGSSTVAITTTAAIMGLFSDSTSLMTALGLTTPVSAVLTVMAIGAGAMTVSQVNDSYFWVVTTFSGLDTKSGYKTQTLLTLLLGITAIATIMVINALI